MFCGHPHQYGRNKNTGKWSQHLNTNKQNNWQLLVHKTTTNTMEWHQQYVTKPVQTDILDSSEKAYFSDPRNSHRWYVRLSYKELLAGYVMERRGMWLFPHCTQDCENNPETVDHIFQCKLQDTLCQRLGNILTTWRETETGRHRTSYPQ